MNQDTPKMKYIDKRDLIDFVEKSVEDLQHRIEMHRHLVTSALDKGMGSDMSNRLFVGSGSPHEIKLKEGIKEAIEVLEQTRKAFKSKRLADLRRKLTQLLMDSQ